MDLGSLPYLNAKLFERVGTENTSRLRFLRPTIDHLSSSAGVLGVRRGIQVTENSVESRNGAVAIQAV